MSAAAGGPYRTQHLPPMPDPHTGLPRPPHAPLWPSWNPAEADPDPRHKPEPPPGQGPVLEWFKASRSHAFGAGLLTVTFAFVMVCIFDGGLSWLGTWYVWVAVLWPLPFLLLLRKVEIIAAGADWLLWNKKWVRTYDLAKVKLSPRGTQFNLILTDREGRKLSIPWLQLCDNRALWDLVYNGMLHSAHNGPFSSNREARSTLKLPR